MSWPPRARTEASPAEADAAPALALRALRIARGARVLIEDLSAGAAGGELWCVVGPNGAGKSTLLATLAGLRAPAGGAVTLDARALADWPAAALARRRAFLPQTSHDTFPMRVHEIVMTGRHPHRARWEWEREADARAVDEAIAALSLAPLAQRDVRTLSGGERQRVALASIAAQQAPVLLLDEPLAHLDLHQQIAVLDWLREGCQRAGWLVILSLHDLNLARRYATHALLMDGAGQVTAGLAAHVLTAPHCARALRTPIATVTDGRRVALVPGDQEPAS